MKFFIFLIMAGILGAVISICGVNVAEQPVLFFVIDIPCLLILSAFFWGDE